MGEEAKTIVKKTKTKRQNWAHNVHISSQLAVKGSGQGPIDNKVPLPSWQTWGLRGGGGAYIKFMHRGIPFGGPVGKLMTMPTFRAISKATAFIVPFKDTTQRPK